MDPDDDDSVIPQISLEMYARLKADEVVSGGMIPKLDNAFSAIDRGVKNVIITSAADIAGNNGTILQ